MAKKATKALVIDASVVQAAGGEDAVFPTSKYCRDFLKAVLSICHRVVMTPDIRDEWKEHWSGFARKWRVAMEARKKIVRPGDVTNKKLRKRVLQTASNEKQHDAIEKDLLLIEAALASDSTIAARDDKARKAFSKAAKDVLEIRHIVWVNPADLDGCPIAWLEKGAIAERGKQLGLASAPKSAGKRSRRATAR